MWDLQRSINEALRTAGLKPYNEDISVTADMAEMLSLILRLSVNEGHAPPPVADLGAFLRRAKEQYLKDFEEHPDGELKGKKDGAE